MITVGEEAIQCCPIRFDRIQAGAAAFVAPYWIDNDPFVQGNVTYEVFTDNSSLKNVSEYISRDQSIDFTGVWMLAAIWYDVPEVFFEERVGHFIHITLHILIYVFQYSYLLCTSPHTVCTCIITFVPRD